MMLALSSHSTTVNTRAKWDGSKAIAAAPKDEKVLQYMHAWYSGEKPELKESYKYPHHAPNLNSPANLNGINNALARLSLAKLPTAERDAVAAHLRKHRADAGLDEGMGGAEINTALDLLIESGDLEDSERRKSYGLIAEAELVVMPVNTLPTTFADLHAMRDMQKKMWSIDQHWDDFWTLSWRIRKDTFATTEQKLTGMQDLFTEFVMLVKQEIAEEEVIGSNQITENAFITEVVEADLMESGSMTAAAARLPVKVKMALISPGWGNAKQKRYYPAETIRRDIHLFEGAKMYRNGHNLAARTEENEVGTVDKIIEFLPDGTPLAAVTIFDPALAEKTRNRAIAEQLERLEISVLGRGDLRKTKVKGKDAFIVDRITEGVSVDFVPKGGAHGHGISLLSESEEGLEMTLDKETKTKEDEAGEANQAASTENESAKDAKTQTDESVVESAWLSEADVTGYIEDSARAQNLPNAARNVVAQGHYKTRDEIAFAVDLQAQAIKAVSGAGAIPNLGEAETEEEPAETQAGQILSEEEKQAEFDAVFVRHGA